MDHDLKQRVVEYFSDKVKTHGATARGADWNSTDSQWQRFGQLLGGFDILPESTLNDYGCGYGEVLRYLKDHNLPCQYRGYDLCEEMIQTAKTTFNYTHFETLDFTEKSLQFILDDQLQPADFSIGSGIFNVRLETPDEEWESYIQTCLIKMNKASEKGFAFNLLTSYSDAHLKKDYLYYANPGFWFDFCKQNFSRNVALLHDYNLYEFTIRVRQLG